MVQPLDSTGFRSFTEIINSPSSMSNHEVNETPYYHTFGMTGTHSQAIAENVDGTPQIPNMSYRQMIEEWNLQLNSACINMHDYIYLRTIYQNF